MSASQVTTLLVSKIPQGPAPKAALLCRSYTPDFKALAQALDELDGELDCFSDTLETGATGLDALGSHYQRAYELMVIEGCLSPQGDLLDRCWQVLENSALLIVVAGSSDWFEPLTAAGFSNPALIELDGSSVLIAHKSFAWGSI